MSKRFDTNLEAVLLILDLLVTELALYLAQAIRFTLPYGVQLTIEHIDIHLLIYVYCSYHLGQQSKCLSIPTPSS